MDVRRNLYGGRRFFYRPLAAYYSKHKSKKWYAEATISSYY
jgi:hypothetical protein